MKKLLFLGANFDQIPYIKVAKEKGYYVVGTDINNKAPGIKYLDKYYALSYEDGDGLIKLGRKENFLASDKVFTASSHFAYIGASAFAKKFNIPFVKPEIVDICLNKIKLYKFFKKQNLEVPDWMVINNKEKLNETRKKWKVFYLKSDYSKSPDYCYRVENKIPKLPQKYDRYFRKCFIAQEEIVGTHFRLNLVKDNLFPFFKISDRIALPVNSRIFGKKWLKKIKRLISRLCLENHLVKFDIIWTEARCYFLDIGLEPPLRLGLYLKYLGYNFEKIYFEHLVENKINYPELTHLPKDLIIKDEKVLKI